MRQHKIRSEIPIATYMEDYNSMLRHVPRLITRNSDQHIATLGAEIEMIASFAVADELDQVYSKMVGLLNQKFLVDIPFIPDHFYYAPSYSAQWHPAERADLLKQEYDHKDSEWYNKRRFCVRFEQINELPTNGRGVEIATPIMRMNSYEYLVRGMLETIASCPIEISLTQACGFHVHVGRRGDFSAVHLRRIAKAVVLFEDTMDKFHPPWRQYSNMYTKSNRDMAYGFRKVLVNLDEPQENIPLIKILDGLTREDEVITTINGPDELDKNFKYNFQSCKTYGTVEFRQASATMDVSWTLAWIKIVAAFVEAAIHTKDEVFEEMANSLDDLFGMKSSRILKAKREMLQDFLALRDPEVFYTALWKKDGDATK